MFHVFEFPAMVTEAQRVLSRAALHPLICRKGTGTFNEEEALKVAQEENELLSRIRDENEEDLNARYAMILLRAFG
jgi:hypothetical protein